MAMVDENKRDSLNQALLDPPRVNLHSESARSGEGSATKEQENANEYKVSAALIYAVTVACVGNSFLYGYQIGVINTPASIIQDFYNQTYYERAGGRWQDVRHYDDYLDNESITDEEASLIYGLLRNGLPAAVVSRRDRVTYRVKPEVFGDTQRDLPASVVSRGDRITKDLKPELFGAEIDKLLEPWEIQILWSTTVAAFVLFGMIGALTLSKIADFFGRKKGMIIITGIMFVSAILGGITKVAKSPECLIFSRVLAGLHAGWSVSLCPMYLTEISPTKIRGAIGTLHQLAITIGILVSQIFGLKEILGTADLWPLLFAFNAIPAFISLIFMPFAPMSPRYLLIHLGKDHEARDVLKKLRNSDNVEDEMEDMRIEASKSASIKNCTLKELLTAPELRIPVIIACVLQITQQWTGINAVMSYSSSLFGEVIVAKDIIPYLIVGTGIINVVCTVVAVPLMEKVGRRPLLLYPMTGMLLSFIVMCIALNLQKKPDFKDSEAALAIVSIVAMQTYIIGFSVGLGPIPFILVGEIFRQEARAVAMSISTAVNWLCNFTLMLTFPFLKYVLDEFVYLLFCAVLVSTIVFIYFFVPETRDRTFDDIASSFALGGKAKDKNRSQDDNAH